MAKLYRCHNPACSEFPDRRLIFDFWADEPVCPKCKTSMLDPRFGNVIEKLIILHFDPPSHIATHGMGYPACDPGGKWRRGMTRHAPAVNCPLCMESEAWKAANKTVEVPDDQDFEVDLDLQGQVIRRKEPAEKA